MYVGRDGLSLDEIKFTSEIFRVFDINLIIDISSVIVILTKTGTGIHTYRINKC